MTRRKGSNNKVKGKGNKGSDNGGNIFDAIQIEESARGKPMEKVSVCISQREGTMPLGKVFRHCQGNYRGCKKGPAKYYSHVL